MIDACPKCGAGKILNVAYGLPTVETGEAAERGEVFLGGCVPDLNAGRLACAACHATFFEDGSGVIEAHDNYADWLKWHGATSSE